jgi:hypothetical protein
VGPAALRTPALACLNLFQSLQWSYRMWPPLQWLYRRLESVNKYRYFKDYFRRSNFWSSEYERADERLAYGPLELETQSPFGLSERNTAMVRASATNCCSAR